MKSELRTSLTPETMEAVAKCRVRGIKVYVRKMTENPKHASFSPFAGRARNFQGNDDPLVVYANSAEEAVQLTLKCAHDQWPESFN